MYAGIGRLLIACIILLACVTPAADLPKVTITPIPFTQEAITYTYEATAYTWTGNRTATGTWPQEGRTVATDPAVIPHGSRLTIDGQPGYVAEDSGSAVRGRIIDIYMEQPDRCMDWGRRQVQVVVE
jgi:3D (Asp-Asp-Asp) domain-containing protein